MDESVIRELEKSAKRAGMKLSAAIRIGAKLRPQCRAFYAEDGATCALGAAFEAITHRLPKMDDPELDSVLDPLAPTAVLREVVTRNDDGQTREEIADWLESIGY